MCRAEEKENGYVDFTNARQHEMANPNYGVSVRADDLMNDAMQALNDPQNRKDFFAKSLNIYTASKKAYLILENFSKAMHVISGPCSSSQNCQLNGTAVQIYPNCMTYRLQHYMVFIMMSISLFHIAGFL